MIRRIYTRKDSGGLAASSDLFKIAAILLIVNKFSRISLCKIQIYLWALLSDDNEKEIVNWKRNFKVTNAPWLMDDDLDALILQCICNHFLVLEVKEQKQEKVVFLLKEKGKELIRNFENDPFYIEINERLKKIGAITDIMLKNVDFYF